MSVAGAQRVLSHLPSRWESPLFYSVPAQPCLSASDILGDTSCMRGLEGAVVPSQVGAWPTHTLTHNNGRVTHGEVLFK